MSDRDLRELLTRVTPEPDRQVSADVVRRAGQRARRRLTVVTVAAATLAMVAAIALPVWLGNDQSEPASDPREPAACPTDPDVQQIAQQTSLPDGKVVSARLCDVPLSQGQGPLANAAPPDVLTGSPLRTFLEKSATGIAEAADRPCRESVAVLTYLQFERSDGATSVLRLPTCEGSDFDYTPSSTQGVLSAFVAAISRQRDDSAAPAPVDADLTSCGERTMINAARPGRERIIAAIYCESTESEPRPLDGDQLAALEDAWSTAEHSPFAVYDCEPLIAPGFIVAADDWGDRLAFTSDGCTGYWVLPYQGYPDPDSKVWHVILTADQRTAIEVTGRLRSGRGT